MRISIETLAGDRYVLGDVLGHGGTAVVVQAHDRQLDRVVAIKLLAENLAADDATRRRFLREARVAARWTHPNIVQVFDAGEEHGRPYMVMEYLDGGSLAEDLRARGPFPPQEVADIGIQVCRGLQHAHDAGLVHRDVKPANLLRAGDGVVKMTDFGIALDPALTSLTEVGTLLGTAAYLAPERVAGGPETPAEDLYSLGVCLYEMLTGRTPYDASTLADLALQQRSGAAVPAARLAPAAPPELCAAIDRCLQRDPGSRPASASVLGEQLAAGVGDGVNNGRVSAPTTDPPATEVLRLHDETTVALRPAGTAAPGETTTWGLPAAVRRRVVALVAGAAAVLLLVGLLVSALGSGTGGANAPAGRLPAPTSEAPPSGQASGRDTGTDATGPEGLARDLADWIRRHDGG